MGRLTSHRETGERYMTLRFVGWLFTVLGSLLLMGSCMLLAFGLYVLRSGGTQLLPETVPLTAQSASVFSAYSRIGGPLWILWSLALLMSGLQSVAIGALFRLAIHLEENTRVSAQCLETLRSRTEPTERNVGPLFWS
jgi:hypothetical protein